VNWIDVMSNVAGRFNIPTPVAQSHGHSATKDPSFDRLGVSRLKEAIGALTSSVGSCIAPLRIDDKQVRSRFGGRKRAWCQVRLY
jgi:hypothetical protein